MKFVPLLLLALLATPALAEDIEVDEDHKVIIETIGEDFGGSLKEILDQVEASVGDDEHNVEVIVIKDQDGNVEVKRLPGDSVAGHIGPHRFARLAAAPHASKAIKLIEHMGELSEDAAGCVIKNLDKVRTDAAAGLLRRACASMHPSTEE